ncbi:MAG TPA: hypothetical protein VFB14_16010 [Bryobacteraceae bacterium]|nr:hypothetical protein [Bryobacteraceae bacterium]
MRHLLVYVLLVAIGVIPVASTAPYQAEAQLPPCCRAHGQHKCALKHAMTGSSSVAGIGAKCPFSEQAQWGPAGFHFLYWRPANNWIASICNHSTVLAQTEARYRVSFSRSRQKRGPPSLIRSLS